jgi:hypothetical protein
MRDLNNLIPSITKGINESKSTRSYPLLSLGVSAYEILVSQQTFFQACGYSNLVSFFSKYPVSSVDQTLDLSDYNNFLIGGHDCHALTPASAIVGAWTLLLLYDNEFETIGKVPKSITVSAETLVLAHMYCTEYLNYLCNRRISMPKLPLNSPERLRLMKFLWSSIS